MSKKRRKPWRGPRADQPQPVHHAELKPYQLRGMARREWIDARALEMFERECGTDLAQFVRTCQLTCELYEQQVQANLESADARGPDVTPYENRMSGSLAARLLREKRTWLRDCRQRIEQALEDEAAAAEEQAEEPQPQAERPVFTDATQEPQPETQTPTPAGTETS